MLLDVVKSDIIFLRFHFLRTHRLELRKNMEVGVGVKMRGDPWAAIFEPGKRKLVQLFQLRKLHGKLRKMIIIDMQALEIFEIEKFFGQGFDPVVADI